MREAQEERRPLDPTRRLLKVFGVKVTDYEERTAALLERAASGNRRPEALLAISLEAVELTEDLNRRLREMTDHVLDTQARVLAELRLALAGPTD
jgi:hypothetical protein